MSHLCIGVSGPVYTAVDFSLSLFSIRSHRHMAYPILTISPKKISETAKLITVAKGSHRKGRCPGVRIFIIAGVERTK